MGKFTDQMTSLTESVVASRQDCISTVKDMASELRRAQASMARQQKGSFAAQKSSLAANCSARARQVDSMRRTHREEQGRMSRDLRHGLAQATNQISISVASLRAGNSSEHAVMAGAQQKQFAEGSRARVKGNDSLMNELGLSRKNMAQKLSLDLENFTLSIRNGTDVMLGGFKLAHDEMAQQLRNTLSSETAALRGDVMELKRGFNDAQNELRDDMQAGAQMWNSRRPAKASQANARADKVTVPSGFDADAVEKAANHARDEVKSQPSKFGSKMSDEEKVIQVVQVNPAGITASQIGEQVSLSSAAVGKIMKRFIRKGKALKDDETRLYTTPKGG